MKTSRQADTDAAEITFGIEIETHIPFNSGFEVGHYHAGSLILSGRSVLGQLIPAPHFRGVYWKAERDGSIEYGPSRKACEFISPVLSGDEGLAALREFLSFAKEVGAKTNASCGIHITIGIKSVIGSSNPKKVAEFCFKVARYATRHQWAIYAQTGKGRHLPNPSGAHYSKPLEAVERAAADQFPTAADRDQFRDLTMRTGRGIVNFMKAAGSNPVIEFRAFAATLEEGTVFHHLATVLGICRKAHENRPQLYVNPFGKLNLTTAPKALRRMWSVLGWTSTETEVAYGLFGILYTNIADYSARAMENAKTFETQFPGVFAVVHHPQDTVDPYGRVETRGQNL